MSAPIRVQSGAATATQDLWRLAETDDTEQLEHILGRGADINASNDDGVTALMRAAHKGRVRMVRALLDHGADLNATRADGFTPLVLAAFFGYTDVVKALVERGADLGTATRFGTSAEMWANARSFPETARYLEEVRGIAHHFGVMAAIPDDEPDNELPVTESVPARRPTSVDSDLTTETPPFRVADQLMSEQLEATPVTEHGSGPASAKPLVVRTLKDPPEIWDLVHEMPAHFDPRLAFVERVTSSKTNIVLLTLAAMFILGLCAFGIVTLRDGEKRSDEAAQVQEERGASGTLPDSQASAPASAPTTAPTSASASAGHGVTDSARPPINLLDLQPDDPASVSKAFTNTTRTTSASVNNISKRTVPRAGLAPVLSANKAAPALSANKNVLVVSGWQNTEKPLPTPNESEAVTVAGAGARLQTPQKASPRENYEKSSSDSASAKKRSNTTLSPQLIAPPSTSAAPKAKVIQWP
jgi:Ankyrin repeats (3 copies)